MAIDSKHPLYDDKVEDWQLMRDCVAGERVVKAAGVRYLPATAGQVLDGALTGTQPGMAAYEAYKARAVFPDSVEVGVQTLIGVLNAKETKIELPPQLEYLRKKASSDGLGLDAVLRKIHEEQLTTGRLGLLADLPEVPDQSNPQQYIAVFPAEKIINWDDGSFNNGQDRLNLVVLDESGWERGSDYSWSEVKRHRVLSLGEISQDSPIGKYTSTTNDASGETALTPMLRGKSLDKIPFVFVSSKDVNSTPDTPPLLGLARICMTIYRAEADYRQTLYLQGQETLVVIGGVRNATDSAPNSALRVGAGARIDVETDGDVKYVGVASDSLEEQRESITNDRLLAAVRTGQLLAPGKMSMESGEALKTRVAAQTATLTSVALAACAGLEQMLKIMAEWQGADPELVKVSPNLDFTNVAIQGQDLVQIITAKNLGAPLSYQSIFEIIRERGLTRNTFEQEIKLIEADPKTLIERAVELAGGADGNNPVQLAGGPVKSTKGVGKKTNEPKT